MALDPKTNSTMAGRITAADANYPNGSSKDETAPGAGDGTPYFKGRADDIFGLQQAILLESDTVPTGNADTAINSQYLQGLKQIIAPLGKNKIINGDFDIWQRATSQTSSGYGSDDRWSNLNIGSTKVHSQQTFTLGQTDVPSNPEFYSRTVVTSVAGAGNFVQKVQRIEGVESFSGEKVAVSFRMKADSAKDIAVGFLQNFGTSGSPSADVEGIEVTTLSLTTVWQLFTVIVDIPSIAGKTLGSDGNDYLQFEMWFDAGSDFNARTNSLGQQSGTFDISHVQIEKSSVVTEFESLSRGQVLELCLPYHRHIANPDGNGFMVIGMITCTLATSDARLIIQGYPMRSRSVLFAVSGSLQSVGVNFGTVSNLRLTTSESDHLAGAILLEADITVGVLGDTGELRFNNDTSAFFSFSSEL